MSIKHRIRHILAQNSRRKEFYREFITSEDLVFDVGANIGNRTRVFLDLGAKVVAVEPQYHCVNLLKRKFRRNSRLIIIPKAVGPSEGIGRIHICNAHTISSMSDEWIRAVKSSGRFSHYRWEQEHEVQITTLDALISQFGLPSFCKIDVEGFESQVLRGLSTPIQMISFEFTPEFADDAIECIMKIDSLGSYVYNWSVGESMILELKDWASSEKMIEILSKVNSALFGDIYAKLVD